MSNTSASNAGVLGRLRSETQTEHTAIEETLDLMRAQLSIDDYRRILERFLGFYKPVELQFTRVSVPADVQALLTLHHRAPLLRSDLVALGVRSPDELPLCDDLPPLTTASECLGCLYVMEGATLGGQVLSRHLERTLGITAESGARFFSGDGPRTGEVWKAFRTAFTGFDTPETQDDVVASAIASFRALRNWCITGPVT
jgi:heme oxygenase (biliverdin-IX-beta and delta-forming)